MDTSPERVREVFRSERSEPLVPVPKIGRRYGLAGGDEVARLAELGSHAASREVAWRSASRSSTRASAVSLSLVRLRPGYAISS
jgi:hypothetical protein